MNQREIDHYRQYLLDMGTELERKVRGLKDEALQPTVDDVHNNLSKTPMHLGDLSSDHYNQEVAADLLEHERSLLAEVNDAIQRIHDGTFGKCEECGEEISRERLDVLPYARHCIECAKASARR